MYKIKKKEWIFGFSRLFLFYIIYILYENIDKYLYSHIKNVSLWNILFKMFGYVVTLMTITRYSYFDNIDF